MDALPAIQTRVGTALKSSEHAIALNNLIPRNNENSKDKRCEEKGSLSFSRCGEKTKPNQKA